MPTDIISLQIADQRIERFVSYSIDADIYTPDDAFTLDVARPERPIAPGQACKLYVNGVLELTGIIDSVDRKYDKRGLTYSISGRDLMGLLVDSYCEDFVSVEGKKLSELAEMLLAKIPLIDRKSIVYQENVAGKLKGKRKTVDTPDIGYMDTPQRISQIEPGMTVFEVLKNYSASRGLLFYALPDGTFVFGRPKAGGEPTYDLTCTMTGQANNILAGEESNDYSGRYSVVRVIGQRQGQDNDGDDPALINTSGTATDPEFPFHKPYVSVDNNDAQSPSLRARGLLERQRHDGYRLTYTVQGHGQGGKNWAINELARVRDEVLGLDKVLLIYGRTFIRSRQGGTTTTLKLGEPGLVAAT